MFISPRITNDTKEFWEACRRHELQLQQCQECDSFYWPAGRFCPHCHSEKVLWKAVSGRGYVFSYVVFHRAFHPCFITELPYIVATIQLAEGPKIISNVIGCKPNDVYMNMPVVHTWRETDDMTIPQFIPDREMI